jgi:hypothetical protein
MTMQFLQNLLTVKALCDEASALLLQGVDSKTLSFAKATVSDCGDDLEQVIAALRHSAAQTPFPIINTQTPSPTTKLCHPVCIIRDRLST